MEIDIKSDTISLTTDNTVHGVVQALAALMEQLADLNKNRDIGTKAPVLFGDGRFDVRLTAEGVLLILGTEIGLVAQPFELPDVLGLMAKIAAVARDGTLIHQPAPAQLQ